MVSWQLRLSGSRQQHVVWEGSASREDRGSQWPFPGFGHKRHVAHVKTGDWLGHRKEPASSEDLQLPDAPESTWPEEGAVPTVASHVTLTEVQCRGLVPELKRVSRTPSVHNMPPGDVQL
jgi:hypothetical protein